LIFTEPKQQTCSHIEAPESERIVSLNQTEERQQQTATHIEDTESERIVSRKATRALANSYANNKLPVILKPLKARGMYRAN
jgi:translation initiation factor 1 (eIF-1/SUI1)